MDYESVYLAVYRTAFYGRRQRTDGHVVGTGNVVNCVARFRPRKPALLQALVQTGAGKQRSQQHQRNKPANAVPAVIMPEQAA